MSKIVQNWSGSVRFRPAGIAYPADEAAMIDLVNQARAAGRKIRLIGSGHSFSPLIRTEDTLLSLDRFQGIVSIDGKNRTAVVRAGTKLRALGEGLFRAGWAMENLGDIDLQSIAGALSTGTHGTGTGFGILATQLAGLRLINGRGEVIECGPEQRPDLFQAAQVSLGALGIITEMKLRLVPAYRLHYRHRKGTLDETLDRLEAYKSGHRHFEFYWFPHTRHVMLKFMDETEAPPKNTGFGSWANDLLLENAAFGLISRLARAFPDQAPRLSELCGQLLSEGERIDQGHRVFATQRLVRFQEMEYNLPAEAFAPVMRKIDAVIRRRRFAVHFPIECRWAKGDDAWLSPAYGRDSAYIAVHMYRGMPYRDYFQTLEEIFRDHGGRPHWGKINTAGAGDFAALYPRWRDFLELRNQIDPAGVFLNDYLQNIFFNKPLS